MNKNTTNYELAYPCINTNELDKDGYLIDDSKCPECGHPAYRHLPNEIECDCMECQNE